MLTSGEPQEYQSFTHIFIEHLLGARHWRCRVESPDRELLSLSSQSGEAKRTEEAIMPIP